MEEMDLQSFSKKERKKIKQQLTHQEQNRKDRSNKVMLFCVLLIIAGIVGFGIWVFLKETAKPLPGEVMPNQGRDHVKKEEWEKFAYNSNPPTSGPHDITWIKPNIYDTPQPEGMLVHSLEHGYIIISYNCSKSLSYQQQPAGGLFTNAYAQNSSPSAESSAGASLVGEVWTSTACQDLKKQLADIANAKRLWKLIVVPRPQLDTPIALTAWTRVDKLNIIDRDRMNTFISTFRDKGPEQTME